MKRPFRSAPVLALLIALGGCVQAYEPKLAEVPKDPEKYQRDLGACRVEADQDQPLWKGAQGILIGTAFGAGIGAVIGGFAYANTVPSIWWGMLAGGGTGAVAGAADGYNEQTAAVDDCIDDRGYPVQKAAR